MQPNDQSPQDPNNVPAPGQPTPAMLQSQQGSAPDMQQRQNNQPQAQRPWFTPQQPGYPAQQPVSGPVQMPQMRPSTLPLQQTQQTQPGPAQMPQPQSGMPPAPSGLPLQQQPQTQFESASSLSRKGVPHLRFIIFGAVVLLIIAASTYFAFAAK